MRRGRGNGWAGMEHIQLTISIDYGNQITRSLPEHVPVRDTYLATVYLYMYMYVPSLAHYPPILQFIHIVVCTYMYMYHHIA